MSSCWIVRVLGIATFLAENFRPASHYSLLLLRFIIWLYWSNIGNYLARLGSKCSSISARCLNLFLVRYYHGLELQIWVITILIMLFVHIFTRLYPHKITTVYLSCQHMTWLLRPKATISGSLWKALLLYGEDIDTRHYGWLGALQVFMCRLTAVKLI